MSEQLFARLYLDECLPNLLATMLKKEGWTVTTAVIEGQSGKPDSEQIVEATNRGCVFITSDKRTFLAEIGDVKHCGIIITANSVRDAEAPVVAKKISTLLNQYTADEFRNTVLFVSVKD